MNHKYQIINTKTSEIVTETSSIITKYCHLSYSRNINIGDPNSKYYVFDCIVKFKDKSKEKTVDLFDLIWAYLCHEFLLHNFSDIMNDNSVIYFKQLIESINSNPFQYIYHEYLLEYNMYNSPESKISNIGIRCKRYKNTTSYTKFLGFNGENNKNLIQLIFLNDDKMKVHKVSVLKDIVKKTLLNNDFYKLVKNNSMLSYF